MLRTAQQTFQSMSCEARQEHQNAWRRIEARVRDLAATPKAKMFEVHHAVEHARRLYQSELAKGLPADLCERAVLSEYEVQS